MLAFRQFCADSPGDVVAIQAAFYRGATAAVTGHQLVGLLGCAFVMVEPGNISSPSPRKAHELRCGIFRFTLAFECPGQYPAPQNIERGFVQLLELGFVHVGEGNAAGVFAKGAVRKLYGVVVARLDDHPCTVCVIGFADADTTGTLIGDTLQILLGSIQSAASLPANEARNLA